MIVSRGGMRMMTVAQVSKRTGVSVRTLHHYDQIGLLKPTEVTEVGYRLYDDTALDKLYMILVYRELGLSLNTTGKKTTASPAMPSTRIPT